MAVIDDHRVLGHTILPAPAGDAESSGLRELQVRAHELLRSNGAEALVLWQLDPPPKRGGVRLLPTLTVGRAEGAVLAAAGELGIGKVGAVSGPTVRAAAKGEGTDGGTDDAVAALCDALQDAPTKEPARRAVAAARAWVLRGGS